jgi:3-oxoadipate enol-lactonase
VTTCALHHEISGPADAPPLVLTGSLGTDLTMWDPQVQALAQRFRVIRCDVRGHGSSPVRDGPYAIADLGQDLLALLDHLGVRRAALVGLSIGAMISLWAAAHAPDRVRALVACCTTARFDPDTATAYRERAARVRTEGLEPIADAVVERWFTPDFARRRSDVVARFRRGLVATPAEGYAACCEALATLDLTNDLSRIQAPALVIAGQDDPATPPEHGRAIADALARAQFCPIVAAAHLASVERAELVTALMLRFLNSDPEHPDGGFDPAEES